MQDNPVSVSCTPAHPGATRLMWCVTLKRKGTETGGQRKLSSEPEEVGLPEGGGGRGTENDKGASGRGLESELPVQRDTNSVFKSESLPTVSRHVHDCERSCERRKLVCSRSGSSKHATQPCRANTGSAPDSQHSSAQKQDRQMTWSHLLQEKTVVVVSKGQNPTCDVQTLAGRRSTPAWRGKSEWESKSRQTRTSARTWASC